MFETGNGQSSSSHTATVTLTEADLLLHIHHIHKLTLTGPVDTVNQKNRADETEPSADPNLHPLINHSSVNFLNGNRSP